MVLLSSRPFAEERLTSFGWRRWFRRKRRADRLAQPAGENEPPPDERLPPGEARAKLRWPTARNPELQGQRNALIIEPSDATLKTLPTNADQEMPTPSGPTDPKMLSHTFFLREHFQGGRDAGSTGRVGEPETPDSPKESFHLTLPFPKRSGRAHSNGCSRRASLWGEREAGATTAS